MRKIIFELCAETVGACLAARDGGADRIELCSGLSEGGVTPSHGLVREAVQQSALPVHGLVRPRGGNYVYTEAEIAVMAEDILHMKSLGVAGVVLGLLKADRTVDVETTRNFVQLARPLEVTFHRAFDDTLDLEAALEDVIATGCDRVLTSGGYTDVVLGAEMLGRLVAQSAGRIDVAVGGGLRLANASELVRLTGATHFHGSLRTGKEKQAESVDGALVPEAEYRQLESAVVREMIEQLQQA